MLDINYVVLEYKKVNVVKGLMHLFSFDFNSIVAWFSTLTRAVKNNVRYKWMTFREVGD